MSHQQKYEIILWNVC